MMLLLHFLLKELRESLLQHQTHVVTLRHANTDRQTDKGSRAFTLESTKLSYNRTNKVHLHKSLYSTFTVKDCQILVISCLFFLLVKHLVNRPMQKVSCGHKHFWY